MSFTKTRAQSPFVTAISLLLLFCVTAVVLFAALRSPLKDDIAWLLYVARRWVSGREPDEQKGERQDEPDQHQ